MSKSEILALFRALFASPEPLSLESYETHETMVTTSVQDTTHIILEKLVISKTLVIDGRQSSGGEGLQSHELGWVLGGQNVGVV